MLTEPEASKASGERGGWDKSICDIVHRYLNRKQTPDQIKWCADKFAKEIPLIVEENRELSQKLAGLSNAAELAKASAEVQPECNYCWHAYQSMKCRHGGK